MNIPPVPERHVTQLACLLPQGPHPDEAPAVVVAERVNQQARTYANALWVEAYLAGATAPAAQPGERVNVRQIVLDVVAANPEAQRAYMHDPAMHHGVEVTIGVLGRAAEVLTAVGHRHPEAVEIIRQIAVACSHRGGPEDEQALGEANSRLFPPAGT